MKTRMILHRIVFCAGPIIALYFVFVLTLPGQREKDPTTLDMILVSMLVLSCLYMISLFFRVFYDLLVSHRAGKWRWLLFVLGLPVTGTYAYFETYILSSPSKARALREITKNGTNLGSPEPGMAITSLMRKRALAAVIDYGIYLFFAGLMFYFFGHRDGRTISLRGGPGVLVFLAWWLYFPILESLRGKTPGKALLGLRVVGVTGAIPLLRQAIARRLCDIVDIVTFMFLPIIVRRIDDIPRRLGDRLGRTFVIGATGDAIRPQVQETAVADDQSFTWSKPGPARVATAVYTTLVLMSVAYPLSLCLGILARYAGLSFERERLIAMLPAFYRLGVCLFFVGVVLTMFLFLNHRGSLRAAKTSLAVQGAAFWLSCAMLVALNWGSIKASDILGHDQYTIEGLTKAIIQNPDDAQSYYERGVLKNEQGDHVGAIADFTTAIKIKPDFHDAYFKRGNANDDLGNKEAAIRDYSKDIELNPSSSAAFFNRGNLKDDLKEYEAAIADFSKAIELDPEYVKAFCNRGISRRHLKDYRGAIEDYSKAIALDPGDPVYYSNRGIAETSDNDYADANADFSKSIALKPDYANAYANRGFLKGKLEDYRGAIEDYSKAIEIEPGNASAYNNRAWNKHLLGDTSGASRDVSKALELDSLYASAIDTRGVIKLGLGNVPGAVKDCEFAVRLDSSNSEFYTHLGEARQAQGNVRAAMKAYDRAIQLDQESAEALYQRGMSKLRLALKSSGCADIKKAVKLGFKGVKTDQIPCN